MKREKHSYLMRDYADTDPRSFKAAVQGRGDDRMEAYDRYCREALARDPGITDEQLGEDYPAYVRLKEQKQAWRDQSMNPLFNRYRRAFLAAMRAREDRKNSLDHAAARHPSEIYDRAFDFVMTHPGGGAVMAVILFGIWQLFS